MFKKNDVHMFEEEYLPLTKFQEDVSRGVRNRIQDEYEGMVADPFYHSEKVKNYVPTPNAPSLDDAVSVLEHARSIVDVIHSMGGIIEYIRNMDEFMVAQDKHIQLLQSELRTLHIENRGPQGLRGLPGERGTRGWPGEPAPDLNQDILNQVSEMMETYKDLQEQIDDINEEM